MPTYLYKKTGIKDCSCNLGLALDRLIEERNSAICPTCGVELERSFETPPAYSNFKVLNTKQISKDLDERKNHNFKTKERERWLHEISQQL